MTQVQTEAGNACYLASVIVPRTSSTRDITVLETAMQGLAQDARHPVALELAATASSRHFLLRATSAHVPEASRRPGAGTLSPGDYSSTDPGGRSPGAAGGRDSLSGRIARRCSGISSPARAFANENCCKKEPIPSLAFWACSTTCQLICA